MLQIFGWFLEPGKLYELHSNKTEQEQGELQQPKQQPLTEHPQQHCHNEQKKGGHTNEALAQSSKLQFSDAKWQSKEAAARAGRLHRLHPVHMRPAPPAPTGSTAGSAKLRKPVVLVKD